ncbi:uncharacterized protein BYT42DRAFT_74362 [Radiomyces spectabilis]|uniref:uncharacterized protein n=1 Tax=Radiomyces spectabilis TaxID=64574 RepID=UPI00221FF26F|nr:uncharacterized protein BYT42DRAFT_74362 [Radiomyces spectabilis]KAI8371593.1 hypothetical protein BYT42DRAFT_74362 [Radiomyces spectabilis]
MGKSAKFYKRPTKKEKEGNALRKLATTTPVIAKKQQQQQQQPAKKTALADAIVKTDAAAMDIDDTSAKKKPTKKTAKDEGPDYVDLLTGKKTYKKTPGKRRH